MVLRCVAATVNSAGESVLVCVQVVCSRRDHKEGRVDDAVNDWLTEQGYGNQRVIFDDRTYDDWFFERHDWSRVPQVSC